MNYAVILSGGIGTRMNNLGVPKQYFKVKNKMILEYTMELFEKSESVDFIVLVIADEWKTDLEQILRAKYTKLAAFAKPGRNRQESILHGLEECIKRTQGHNDVVIVHDAVRPCLSLQLIKACVDSIPEYDGSMPVLPMKDTIYQSNDGKAVSRLLERSRIFAGQAPEAFLLQKYYEANKSLPENELMKINGSTEVAFKASLDICMIPGEESNFKITTQEDLKRFTEIVEGR